jgi:hypothetical protein
MERAKEAGGDGDVVLCGGRVDGDDGHCVFIVSQIIFEITASYPAGRARCARSPHKRGAVCGDPDSGGRLHAFLTCVGRSTVAGLPLVG